MLKLLTQSEIALLSSSEKIKYYEELKRMSKHDLDELERQRQRASDDVDREIEKAKNEQKKEDNDALELLLENQNQKDANKHQELEEIAQEKQQEQQEEQFKKSVSDDYQVGETKKDSYQRVESPSDTYQSNDNNLEREGHEALNQQKKEYISNSSSRLDYQKSDEKIRHYR